MKQKSKFLAIILISSGSIFYLNSCKNAAKTENKTDSTMVKSTVKKDSTATVYACSMHPEITGKKGDKCSKCSMDLVAKAEK